MPGCFPRALAGGQLEERQLVVLLAEAEKHGPARQVLVGDLETEGAGVELAGTLGVADLQHDVAELARLDHDVPPRPWRYSIRRRRAPSAAVSIGDVHRATIAKEGADEARTESTAGRWHLRGHDPGVRAGRGRRLRLRLAGRAPQQPDALPDAPARPGRHRQPDAPAPPRDRGAAAPSVPPARRGRGGGDGGRDLRRPPYSRRRRRATRRRSSPPSACRSRSAAAAWTRLCP